ncbi:ROK family protein [Suilimivivens sp.]|jgi:ROK family protein|uniref:ROK family protein n=1 Tax=Suilimivivens sp. TaxID=2981669 RepID=UPI00307BD974
MRIGALEAGGTKMVCAVGDENGQILERASIVTENPDKTMPEILEFFRQYTLDAIGIGTFGPVDLDRTSPTYGYITSTPKISWRNFNLLGSMKREFAVPIGLDTDVNASAIGEASYGITRGLDSSIYITVGTGIGVGVILDGKAVHGMQHPEAGHILLVRHPEDNYTGRCPYHPNCLEGLASGPAIEERFGVKAAELPGDSLAWEIESFYLAQALVDFTLVYSPKRIVLGGGVMHQKQLFPKIREKYREMLNHYVDTPYVKDLNNYIVPYSLDDNQGIMGCIRIGLDEMER